MVAAMTLAMGVSDVVSIKVTPKSQFKGYQDEKEVQEHLKGHKEEEPGFFEGLKLLVSQPYLMGMFWIITIYEVIVTVFDYHLKSMSKAMYPTEAAHAAYLTNYAVMTGIVRTACILLGINNIQRRLGTTVIVGYDANIECNYIYEAVCAHACCGLWLLQKAINYALNQPTLKQAVTFQQQKKRNINHKHGSTCSVLVVQKLADPLLTISDHHLSRTMVKI